MFIHIENSVSQYSLENGDPLITEIYIALTMQKGSFFVEPSKGLGLSEIKKSVSGIDQQIKDICLSRLAYLLTNNKVKEIDIAVAADNRSGKAKTTISVLKLDNTWKSFQVFVRVV